MTAQKADFLDSDLEPATQELLDFLKAEQDKQEQQETLLKALGEHVGISRRKGSPKTPPKDYPDDPSEYGDPANYNFPTDEARYVKSVGRFNGGQGKEQYSLSERHAVGRRVARLASRFGDQYSYDRSNQQIVNAKEKKTMTEKLSKETLDALKAMRDQVDDKEAFDAIVAKMAGPTDPSQPVTIENPPVKTPGATVMKVEDKPAPATTSGATTSPSDDTTASSTTTTPPPAAKKSEDGDALAALDAKVNKTLEAVGKLADSVAKMATMNKSEDGNDPFGDLSAILTSEASRRMPLEGDDVIKMLESTDPYALQKALRVSYGKHPDDQFAGREAFNDINTKLRKATIDELNMRGFTALNMVHNVAPLPQ